MSNNSSRYVKVTVNNVRLANVIGAEIHLEREPTVDGNTLSVSNKLIKAKITREKWLGDSRSDGQNLRTLSKFALAIEYPGLKSTFANCEWIEFKETIADDGTVTEQMTIASTSYTVST